MFDLDIYNKLKKKYNIDNESKFEESKHIRAPKGSIGKDGSKIGGQWVVKEQIANADDPNIAKAIEEQENSEEIKEKPDEETQKESKSQDKIEFTKNGFEGLLDKLNAETSRDNLMKMSYEELDDLEKRIEELQDRFGPPMKDDFSDYDYVGAGEFLKFNSMEDFEFYKDFINYLADFGLNIRLERNDREKRLKKEEQNKINAEVQKIRDVDFDSMSYEEMEHFYKEGIYGFDLPDDRMKQMKREVKGRMSDSFFKRAGIDKSKILDVDNYLNKRKQCYEMSPEEFRELSEEIDKTLSFIEGSFDDIPGWFRDNILDIYDDDSDEYFSDQYSENINLYDYDSDENHRYIHGDLIRRLKDFQTLGKSRIYIGSPVISMDRIDNMSDGDLNKYYASIIKGLDDAGKRFVKMEYSDDRGEDCYRILSYSIDEMQEYSDALKWYIDNRQKVNSLYNPIGKVEESNLSAMEQEIAGADNKIDFSELYAKKVAYKHQSVMDLAHEMGQNPVAFGSSRNQKLYVLTMRSWNINAYAYTPLEKGDTWDDWRRRKRNNSAISYAIDADNVENMISIGDGIMKPSPYALTGLRRICGLEMMQPLLGYGFDEYDINNLADDEESMMKLGKRLRGLSISNNGYSSITYLKTMPCFEESRIEFDIKIPEGTNIFCTANEGEGEIVGSRGMKYMFTGKVTSKEIEIEDDWEDYDDEGEDEDERKQYRLVFEVICTNGDSLSCEELQHMHTLKGDRLELSDYSSEIMKQLNRNNDFSGSNYEEDVWYDSVDDIKINVEKVYDLYKNLNGDKNIILNALKVYRKYKKL